ncbi:hypothetical protein HAX54_040582 [Datura stramonium]|uniref:Uncharacterized protein n=1 Tax=Datura stramonium TaxID=4076 RepID=A0ABS8SKF5_DATST|nr:hypothetical protein [Datura stramonium]
MLTMLAIHLENVHDADNQIEGLISSKVGEIVDDGVKKPPGEEIVEDATVASKRKRKAKGGMDYISKYIPLPIPPFPQRLAKQVLDAKVKKHVKRPKEAIHRVLFVDAINEIPSFEKYLKKLLTRKFPSYNKELVPMTHRVCTIIARNSVTP